MAPLALLLLLFLAIFGVLLLASMLRGRGTVQGLADGGACGRCQYNVRGLTTFLCPECGADLREVGILPPAQSGVTLSKWVVVILVVTLMGLSLMLLMFAWASAPAPMPAPPAMPAPTPVP
jgi:hypothetical protein